MQAVSLGQGCFFGHQNSVSVCPGNKLRVCDLVTGRGDQLLHLSEEIRAKAGSGRGRTGQSMCEGKEEDAGQEPREPQCVCC